MLGADFDSDPKLVNSWILLGTYNYPDELLQNTITGISRAPALDYNLIHYSKLDPGIALATHLRCEAG